MMQNKMSPTFNPDGSISSEGYKACDLMKIEPESLKAITVQDLVNEGIEPHIAQVRVEHLSEKRLKRIEMLDNTIRTGMLGQLQSVMEAVQNQSHQKSKLLTAAQPTHYQESDMQPDLPLRMPLDPENRLNRKLAKQIYNSEKYDKVNMTKEELDEQKRNAEEAIMKKEKKQLKKSNELAMIKKQELQDKVGKENEKRQNVKIRHQQETRVFEKELREKHREMKQQEAEFRQQIAQEAASKEKQQFLKDLENFQLQASRQGEAALKKQRDNQDVEIRMATLEQKKKQGDTGLLQSLDAVKAKANSYTAKADEIANAQREIEYRFDIKGVYDHFQRIKKSEKIKKDTEKHAVQKLREAREEKQQLAKVNQDRVKMGEKEKKSYLRQKDAQRGLVIQEIKDALHEDVEQKKEISILKKKDQMENWERGKNFHQLYKQKLVERILEKKERAERVKHQQQRIASICGTQRLKTNRAFSQTATQILGGGSLMKDEKKAVK